MKPWGVNPRGFFFCWARRFRAFVYERAIFRAGFRTFVYKRSVAGAFYPPRYAWRTAGLCSRSWPPPVSWICPVSST